MQLFGEIVILCRAHGSAFPEGQVSEQSANSAPRRFKMVINPQITQSAAALESPISKTASLQLEKCDQFRLELTLLYYCKIPNTRTSMISAPGVDAGRGFAFGDAMQYAEMFCVSAGVLIRIA
ncbi:MAG: hypothetical protein ACK5AN_24360 [Planctomyces sp.]